MLRVCLLEVQNSGNASKIQASSGRRGGEAVAIDAGTVWAASTKQSAAFSVVMVEIEMVAVTGQIVLFWRKGC